jgi:hypothetical protein
VTYRCHAYATHDDACAAAETLEAFGSKPAVMGPVLVALLRDGGEVAHWEVGCVVPDSRQLADALDLDEAVDYGDSHWDREAEDRDLHAGRSHVEF